MNGYRLLGWVIALTSLTIGWCLAPYNIPLALLGGWLIVANPIKPTEVHHYYHKDSDD